MPCHCGKDIHQGSVFCEEHCANRIHWFCSGGGGHCVEFLQLCGDNICTYHCTCDEVEHCSSFECDLPVLDGGKFCSECDS